MKIVVAGSTGMLGSALVPVLRDLNHAVLGLARHAAPGCATWDPGRGILDPSVLEGADAVVNLAGAGIAEARWTAARRREIMESRVRATRLLVDTCGRLPRRPKVFVSASATGYYGDGGDRELAEDEPPGGTFLAQVCERWEAEAGRAAPLGMRVVCLRLGMILSASGGALAKMVPVFRAGLGGPAGGGRQWVSWIALDDAVAAVAHALIDPTLAGAVNAVAPGAVRNAEFARALGAVLGRPALVPAPAALLRLAFGEMAEQTILQSARVVPRELQRTDFRWRHADVRSALRSVLIA